MSQIACGFLNDDGTRCDQPAVAVAIITAPAVSVPCCVVHKPTAYIPLETD